MVSISCQGHLNAILISSQSHRDITNEGDLRNLWILPWLMDKLIFGRRSTSRGGDDRCPPTICNRDERENNNNDKKMLTRGADQQPSRVDSRDIEVDHIQH